MANERFSADRARVGFVGLGRMGSGMVQRLLEGGFAVTVYDLRPEPLAQAVAAGASRAEGPAELVAVSDVVLTSLPSSAVTARVLGAELLPSARAGQVFLDMGTTDAEQTRLLAGAFADKGAALLDCPVSGPPLSGQMRVFIGGDRQAADRCRPIFDALTQSELAVCCGPTGHGQAVKGVNQLAMGLVDAAYVEAVAYGVRCGVDPAIIGQAVGGTDGFRARVSQTAQRVVQGRAESYDGKFPELPYFLAEADRRGFALPMTAAMHAFCDGGPRNWADNMDRPYTAYWHQLIHAQGNQPPTK